MTFDLTMGINTWLTESLARARAGMLISQHMMDFTALVTILVWLLDHKTTRFLWALVAFYLPRFLC